MQLAKQECQRFEEWLGEQIRVRKEVLDGMNNPRTGTHRSLQLEVSALQIVLAMAMAMRAETKD